MTLGTVCSGIGAPEIAFGRYGFVPLWFSEIDRFPSAVLAHHFPNVPNIGDFTAKGAMEYMVQHPPDVMMGGPPCQSFSFAGKRESLSDDRGNLTLKFVELWHALRAVGTQYAVWENVPGVLNTKDNAFGCFLAGLVGEEHPLTTAGGKWTGAGLVAGPGGVVAWRIFDAQYYRVPQRRRRVFAVVGHPSDFSVSKILFEPESDYWNFAPGAEAGQGTAPSIGTGPYSTRWDTQRTRLHDSAGIAPTLSQSDGKGEQRTLSVVIRPGESLNGGGETVVLDMRGNGDGKTVNTLTGDHASRPTDYTPIVFYTKMSGTQKCFGQDNISPCLKGDHNSSTSITVPFAWTQNQAGDLLCGEVAPAMGTNSNASGRNTPKVATYWDGGQLADTQDVSALVKQQCMPEKRRFNAVIEPTLLVRRLTPLETERLQGLPDDWTKIPWRMYQQAEREGISYEALLAQLGMKLREPAGEDCPDGPRYKAIGNSMCVNVVEFIAKRIKEELESKNEL